VGAGKVDQERFFHDGNIHQDCREKKKVVGAFDSFRLIPTL